MADGIILAAGYSSRAKTNKMLLVYKNKPLIRHAIDGMMPFVSHIFVITGHYHEEIMEALQGIKHVYCIENKNYHQGMFSSIQTGADVVSDDFFVLPGDCPFVHPSTYEKLLLGTKEMRVPSFMGRKGHPLFIAKHLIKPLIDEPVISNLKVFRNRYDLEIIETTDPNILTDIDTIEDYMKLSKPTGKDEKDGN
ncbi:MAG: molybdopterin-guanine dinucleotide biosynthesis protein A [Tenericutes bacterium HGW-Tenericutes-3]|nr:MAG: molybdopterin-guanine dinucleotide biosynthesis protein A [Tenericutes bacterium HGW-Tenericutes-3]